MISTRISERSLSLLCAVLTAASFAGCAPSVARPPEPRPAPAAPVRPADPGPAAGQAAQAQQPGSDPSEEITPSELASIPDPVPSARESGSAAQAPGRQKGDLGAESGSPVNSPQDARSASSGLREPALGDSEATIPDSDRSASGYVWRVQIFASQDLSLADRKAKEAEERLGVKAHIEFEASFYKVRLGDYPSEEGAQSLRDRAVQAGFTGAFRVRCEPDTTQY